MRGRHIAYRAVRPLLFRIDSEQIHHASLSTLRLVGASRAGRRLAGLAGGTSLDGTDVVVAGLRFRSRVGLGAGFDKDSIALRGWAALGLGFAEVGTVTPLPQAGNPRPRLFRLARDQALINRMGFNNAGAQAVARNLAASRRRLPPHFVVGVNIGPNASTAAEDTIRDYLAVQQRLAPHADYWAVNVSSPNTPGLRALQSPKQLRALLDALANAGQQLGPARPIFVKLAPDMLPGEMEAVLTAVLKTRAKGLILANTTLSRDRLASDPELAAEAGGLSGAPLLTGTRGLVRRARSLVGDRLAIIASGGIGSAQDAATLIAAGADLVQLWSGLVFAGPCLIGETTKATTKAVRPA